MRIVIAFVALSLLFGLAAALDPSRIRALVHASVEGYAVLAYLTLLLEPFLIVGVALLAVRFRQWMVPVLLVAVGAAILARAPLELGALLLATAIVAWPPRWSRSHLHPA